MATVKYVGEVAEKQSDGTLGSYTPIGTSFNTVIDTSGTNGGYNLKQFYDSYMKFMRETPFVYYGSVTPQNSHIKVWIDTNTSA